jgi:hypothetical protein
LRCHAREENVRSVRERRAHDTSADPSDQISMKANRRTRGGGHRYYRRSQTVSHDDRRAPDLVRPPRTNQPCPPPHRGRLFFSPPGIVRGNRFLAFLAENLGFVSRRPFA